MTTAIGLISDLIIAPVTYNYPAAFGILIFHVLFPIEVLPVELIVQYHITVF